MNPIALVFALIAAGVLMPALYMGISTYGDQTLAVATALQMAHVQKAAEGYITTYAAIIDANSTATKPAIITVPMLVNTGFLPNGFGAANPYGQTWEVQVLQPEPQQLQSLVLGVGGNAIPARQSGIIATTAGDSGGVIGGGTGDYTVPGCPAGEACGAYAGWSVSTAGYQNVAAAHPAALIEYANNQLQSDYLYRVSVPGQPQLNTMQTNLDMGNNNVQNANNVQANTAQLAGGQPNGQPGALKIGSAYYYGDSNNAAVRTPGGFYIQNQNGSGPAPISEVSNIQASGLIGAAGEPATSGYPSGWGGGIHTWDGYANGTWGAGTNGSLNAYMNSGGVVYAGNQAILGTANGGANIGWGCGPNGSIAANANGSGQILACQGGTWQAVGGDYLGITQQVYQSPALNNVGVVGLGWFRYCAVDYNQANAALWPGAYGGNGYWYWYFNGAGTTFSAVACYD